MTSRQATPILARWVRELRRDLRLAHYRNKQLELRLAIQEGKPLDDIYSYWLDHHQPDSIVRLAGELEAV